ncbi:1-phosphofructokinase [Nitrospirillum sp. BR 11163]|uniref:1-phosphofructokinase n=1 Tax=Nitrospirillum sp. BR 11163 TaxID=3104323 RepID=UPI002AFFF15C|nr:1-phosphofructokinase [Nitrospirillum sp. BR 11163]MEA1674679.1 1-phosphofructokinase [Nitrospirillum sp. BR 11163]
MSIDLHTVTLNPAIDETVTLDDLRPGHVHRAAAVRHNAGGKGVNVASCLADWGLHVAATGLMGIDNTAPFEALFAAKGILDRFLRVPGETRTNIKLLDRHDGRTTDINLPGLAAAPETVERIQTYLEESVGPGTLVVLAGSLPDGLPPDTYASMVAGLAHTGARVVLDSSGEPLARALAADVLPHCVKPNRHELEGWAGRPLAPPDLLAAARHLQGHGIPLVVVSLGAGGALFVDAGTALHAQAPEVRGNSTVGAGDAMVAGLAAGLHAGLGLEAVARLATAFAVAKLGRAGPHLPGVEIVRALADQVTMTPADDWASTTATHAPH